MTEHPILFSGPMVRAILKGRKTQTRRVSKVQSLTPAVITPTWVRAACPYGELGERLWVRTAHMRSVSFDRRCVSIWDEFTRLHRFSTGGCDVAVTRANLGAEWKLKPSIHMPRWASRITLEITSVRVERVQEIGEADAIAEGCCAVDFTAVDIEAIAVEKFDEAAALLVALGPGTFTAKSEYAMLWDRINGKRPGCAWSDNPWVWVIEFKRLEVAQ